MTTDTQREAARTDLDAKKRRLRRLEVLLAAVPLLAVGIGCALVYFPLGLIVPGLLMWWDLREDQPPPEPKKKSRRR